VTCRTDTLITSRDLDQLYRRALVPTQPHAGYRHQIQSTYPFGY
jgi:hypothetical protein